MINSWISNGLREFWEIATVLRLAARAFCKQYCLTLSGAKGSCIAWASQKTGAPKLSAALMFLCLLSLHQGKESKLDLWQAKEPNELTLAKPNEKEILS